MSQRFFSEGHRHHLFDICPSAHFLGDMGIIFSCLCPTTCSLGDIGTDFFNIRPTARSLGDMASTFPTYVPLVLFLGTWVYGSNSNFSCQKVRLAKLDSIIFTLFVTFPCQVIFFPERYSCISQILNCSDCMIRPSIF